ncbi:MAG: hypothetical protein IJY33_02200 [Oscillospiraceae bacterium]|nr:hypothetical protein [Oscillospiraceae bacterium]
MKKSIPAFFIVLVLLLSSSCSKSSGKPQSLQTNIPFTCTAQINYDTLSLEAKLTYRNAAGATLEVLSPDSLQGLIFEYDGENTTASYKGLSFSLAELNSALPSAARLIFSSLASASTEKNTEDAGDSFKISGSLDSVPYTLYFDKKSGYLEKFSCPSLKFTADFKDFKFLD